jgi:hypothetical protein
MRTACFIPATGCFFCDFFLLYHFRLPSKILTDVQAICSLILLFFYSSNWGVIFKLQGIRLKQQRWITFIPILIPEIHSIGNFVKQGDPVKYFQWIQKWMVITTRTCNLLF